MGLNRTCKGNHAKPWLGPAGALYLHVPLCRSKCRYCDFYSVRHSQRLAERFVEAALIELAAGRPALRTPLRSVFVGGGTPTVLEAGLLAALLSPLRGLIDEDTEFSVEANPCTIDAPVAEALAAAGVNRVSLGAQSFDADELRLLGRAHSPDQVGDAVKILRNAGITNINLDLMYAIPGQSPASWRSSLARALQLQPSHLSCYALSIEEGTPLCADCRQGRVEPMDESLQRECYCAAIEAASAAGMEHYEISNFAAKGRRCRHNLTYWNNLPYVGIGPAAGSYIDTVRSVNTRDVERYIAVIRAGGSGRASSERLGRRKSMAELLMMSLRLIEGVDIHAFTERFGVLPAWAFPRSISRHLRTGALVSDGVRLRLATEALFVADAVLADILAEA